MIPNGRDVRQFRPRSGNAESPRPTLMFVGALTPQKQPGRFIEVVRRLQDDGREIRAVMVGDGPLAPTLGPLARASGIELLGGRPDVPELLREADLFVFTSLPTGEGMPGVLIEAGLSGVPAVSTRVPGAASVLIDGRTGLIVEDSVAAIAAGIGDLLDAPERRTAMGLKARTRCAEEFGLELMCRRWEAALRPMVERRLHHGA